MKKNSFKSLTVALSVLLTSLMVCSVTVNAATPTGKRLKDVQSRVMVGTEFSSGFTNMDSTFFNTATPEFNIVTAENCMKWSDLEPSQNNFTWTEGDRLVNWAKANNYTVHGHTFVWYNQTPNWVQNLNANAMEAAMNNHIDKVMAHYKGKIPIWDVANECFEDNGTYRNSFWYRVMGKSYIEKAFIRARAADPSVKLIYNDYNLEYTGPKSNAAYEMLKDFKSRGIPVDGIGFQMHLDIQYAIDYNDFAKNMQRFADLGLEIYITEMDVRVSSNTNSAELDKQASYYKNIIEKCMAQPAVKAIQFWGFTDKYSWVPGTFQGRDNALLFDKNYNPKSAYYAVQAALATTPVPKVIYGDLDGNGSVDAIDYSLLKQYLLGAITKFPAENGLTVADVNASGSIDSLDFVIMKQYLTGLITKFPAQE
ncbi:glycoside hydrolase family 10 [Ruminiclostridium papyrosolvens DSM 2782]|uniref:Beta-xylanase n=1 Tax=Ruminiclostridium papyrosolvens DSM 2782 TaxID=588581 RepID=F1TF59_9FIRM|nr:endo-1,4-beta-xylanase [Ruminiclostridium papyrosolvens]EGD46997.1 glycoside hydrolase family 10 [Ruminiclostridium papyrosolvens DSM 2782]WES33754.1 endo-1,4-beta-xylanase [Ruminiclostridium papyrosolvens DSM 2782]